MSAARLVGWLIAIPVALLVVAFAVANRQPVGLELWPLPWSLQIPAYLAVLGALGIGVVLGAAVAGLSTLRARRRAGHHRRHAESLARQIEALERSRDRLPPPTPGA